MRFGRGWVPCCNIMGLSYIRGEPKAYEPFRFILIMGDNILWLFLLNFLNTNRRIEKYAMEWANKFFGRANILI